MFTLFSVLLLSCSDGSPHSSVIGISLYINAQYTHNVGVITIPLLPAGLRTKSHSGHAMNTYDAAASHRLLHRSATSPVSLLPWPLIRNLAASVSYFTIIS